MAKIISSTFTRYEFAANERFVLSDLQVQHLQTLMCITAEAKLALPADANNFDSFIQQEASLQGQLYVLQRLLDESAASVVEIAQEAVVLHQQV